MGAIWEGDQEARDWYQFYMDLLASPHPKWDRLVLKRWFPLVCGMLAGTLFGAAYAVIVGIFVH